MRKISDVFKAYFAPPVMEVSFEDLRRTAKFVVHLASPENSGDKFPLRINARQCELLAKKASEALPVVDEFEGIIRQQERLLEGSERSSTTPDWNLAATELHQVLKAAEVLTRDCCCCEGDWLKVEITRGNLKETFARLLYELKWHTWVFCSLLDETGNEISKKRERCDGNLSFTDNFLLSAAAKHDRESLRELLTSSHVCDSEVCKPTLSGGHYCLAAKLLEKLDAEKQDRSELDSGSVTELMPHFLWVDPGDLPKGRRLGSGSFALVRETEWLGQKFAQKAFFNTSLEKDFKDEIAALIGLSHPNIVHVVCCSEAGPEDTDLEESDLSIVMELMYKSLYALLHKDLSKPPRKTASPFSIVQAVDLMQQIAEGLRYLHDINLVHRDLKSLNILVQVADPQAAQLVGKGGVNITGNTPLVAKIADFGLSKVKNASTLRNNQTANVGTTQWMAPETPHSSGVYEAPSNRFHPKKLDVYSFAIVCYEILTGDEPYTDVPRSQLLARVRAGLRPNLPEGIPGRLAVLIQECWSGDPLLRPDFTAICTELRFIKGLLLQRHNFANDIRLDFNLNLQSVKVQGPWGRLDNGGEMFCDGVFTFIKRILLHFDKEPTNIWYMELEYDVNGTSLVVGHGKKEYGNVTATINIDGPSEYIAQIEGSFGTSRSLPNLTVVQSLTFRTNKKTYGPFGREQETGIGETKFKSDYGRIVGFFGRKHQWLDQIGCFIAPGTITSPPLESITF